jgi:hypothetical protein
MPYSGSLVQYLPLMWEESAEHNMLRCAIVSTLVHVVRVRIPRLCCISVFIGKRMNMRTVLMKLDQQLFQTKQ